MECFRIDWKGIFSWETAQNRPETREDGIYAIYRAQGNRDILQYIGKSKELGSRLGTHRQGTARFMSGKDASKLGVCFGMIYSYETARPSTHITPTQLRNIESFLINIYKPEGNSITTKRGYKREPLIIVNTGKRATFDKVIAHNPEIVTLLKENLSPRRTTRSSSLF